jgi:hypothetical protein
MRSLADVDASGVDNVSGPGAIFRLSGGEGIWITVRVELGHEHELAADIVFRYLERLGQALAGRLESLRNVEPSATEKWSLVARVGLAEPLAARLRVVESVAAPTGLARR